MIRPRLAGIFLFLYITSRQQDYALLTGAIALFVVLAIVMYVTRKADWYARDSSRDQKLSLGKSRRSTDWHVAQ